MFKPLLSILLLGLTAATAQAQPTPWQEGRHYARISTPQPTNVPAGKIEVVEIFSYACHACDAFQSFVDGWLARKPDNVVFTYMPADFNAGWPLMARAYYVAEALGLHQQTHQLLFDRNFKLKKPLRTEEDVITLLVEAGGKPEQVRKAMTSVGIQTRLAQAHRRQVAYQLDSTPTLVVNGKYRISGDGLKSHAEMIKVLDYLIQLESLSTASAKPAN